MLWEARYNDEIPAIEICDGRDQRPRHRLLRYSASAWQLLLEKTGEKNDILSEPDSEEELPNEVDSGDEDQDVRKEEELGEENRNVEQVQGENQDHGVAENNIKDGEIPEEKTPGIDKIENEITTLGSSEPLKVLKSLLVVDESNSEADSKDVAARQGPQGEGKACDDSAPKKKETKVEKKVKKKKRTKSTLTYNMEDSMPATEDQNLALYWAARGLRHDLVVAAVEDGMELFYLNSAWAHWQKRKKLKPIHYNRKWCNSRGWTALHALCSRKGPFDEAINNTAMDVCRTLVNGGWDVCKFSNDGDGFSPVDLAERNKLGKVAVILHTLMPHGHKSVVWKTKQSGMRDFSTSSRAATKEENLYLCWCARGWTGGEQDDDSHFDKYVEPEKKEEPVQFMNLLAKEEEDARLKAEEEARAKLLDENPFVLPPHEGPHAYEDQCANKQRRRQWVGNCLLAAVLHGYQLYF